MALPDALTWDITRVDFFRTLTQNGIGPISLNVQYDPSLYTDPHPLAGKNLDSGPLSRGLFPTDHLGNPIPLFNSPTSFLFPGAFAASTSEFNNVVGHAFDGASPQDLAFLINAVSDGRIQAGAAFVDPTSNDRFTGPFLHHRRRQNCRVVRFDELVCLDGP